MNGAYSLCFLGVLIAYLLRVLACINALVLTWCMNGAYLPHLRSLIKLSSSSSSSSSTRLLLLLLVLLLLLLLLENTCGAQQVDLLYCTY